MDNYSVSNPLILEESLEVAQAYLKNFVTKPDFLTEMKRAFGNSFDVELALSLVQDWSKSDFRNLPQIEIRSRDEINGANGAFASATNTVYLSQEFLKASSAENIASVLLEEIGHAIDARLNQSDSPGDEGAIFSALVRKEVLSPQQLAALKTEDDTATITLDGQALKIEQSNLVVNTNLDTVNPNDGTNPNLFTSTELAGGNLTLNYAPNVNRTTDITVRATDTGRLFVDDTFKVKGNPVIVNDEGLVNLKANFRLFGEVQRFGLGYGDMELQFGVNPLGNFAIGSQIGQIGFQPGGTPFTSGVLQNLPLSSSGFNVVDIAFSVPFSLYVDRPDHPNGSLFVGLGSSETGGSRSGSVQVIFDFSDNIYFGGSILEWTPNQGLSLMSVTLADGTPLSDAGLQFEFIPENTVLTAEASAFDDQGLGIITDTATPPNRAAVFPWNGTATSKLQSRPTDPLLHLDVNPEPDPFVFDLASATVGGANNIRLTRITKNTPPVAQDDSVTTNEDTAIVSNVLTDNGNGADTDPDGDTLTVTKVNDSTANVSTQITLASGALLTLNANGTFNYNPNNTFEFLSVGEIAADTFTYTIEDNHGGTSTATVTVTINGANDVPVAVDDTVTTSRNLPLTIPVNTLLSNDTDEDGDTLALSSVDNATNGSVVLDQNGDVVFAPATNFLGEASFDYTIADGNNGTDTAQVIVTVSFQPTEGDDTLYGTPENDTIDGLGGNDLIFGLGGSDLLYGSEGNDTLDGGEGDDYLNPGTGINAVIGGTGFDFLELDYSAETNDLTINYTDPNNGTISDGSSFSEIEWVIFKSGTGNDTADLSAANYAEFRGNGGDDYVVGGANLDYLEGGFGSDTLIGGEGDDLIEGWGGGDELSDEGDYIDAGGGNDVAYGDAGNDSILGGAGNDHLDGVGGNDTLRGGDGDDRQIGNLGGLFGGEGDDLLSGEAGIDELWGQVGNDTLDGGEGDDVLNGNQGNDYIFGGEGNDIVRGGKDDDAVFGGTENDELFGDLGNDSLWGGEGRDEIIGGDGDDILIGDLGGDTLTGGDGNDRFVYRNFSDRTDQIVDFTPSKDIIVLTEVFSNLGYIGTNPINDGYMQLVQSGLNTLVQIDPDGAGFATFKTLVTLQNVLPNDLNPNNFQF
ncbi:hypothetical protein NIES2119_02310 [[Phormidium ambiguum] IAM M-71]|uniref:Cadherin domain-containing protein n=1 Tax=[Phormidium ambiguum] IAM M-71 TaxID=454136 RepID=A0A1U7ISI9_9CYAN|nr:Ig-like domain-containing protein [Phormidium ambiguum]OKH40471.1 hypothetical protein NIES2119_02310 [Phormidium ambiguum IAM M-71]